MSNIITNTRNKLEQLAEPDYKEFSSRLLPGVDNIIGVRLPHLRKMAKSIASDEWLTYVTEESLVYFEETMLQGMLIGTLRLDIEEVLSLVADFVPKINNWSVCDSFCSGLKIVKKHKKRVWEFIFPYLRSEKAFEIRFAVVIMIFYFIDKHNIREVLIALDSISHNNYYVKMAVAWAVSICYVTLPEITMTYLKSNNLDNDTYNKALQKICESLRIDKATKTIVKQMKR